METSICTYIHIYICTYIHTFTVQYSTLHYNTYIQYIHVYLNMRFILFSLFCSTQITIQIIGRVEKKSLNKREIDRKITK